jgi:hypothetical protein
MWVSAYYVSLFCISDPCFCAELFALGLFVLCYVLITCFRFYFSSYVCLNCFVCFVPYFCVLCFCIFRVFSPYVYSRFFSICVQMYGPLPPGGNPIESYKHREREYDQY